MLASHHRLSGPRRDPGSLPAGQEVQELLDLVPVDHAAQRSATWLASRKARART